MPNTPLYTHCSLHAPCTFPGHPHTACEYIRPVLTLLRARCAVQYLRPVRCSRHVRYMTCMAYTAFIPTAQLPTLCAMHAPCKLCARYFCAAPRSCHTKRYLWIHYMLSTPCSLDAARALPPTPQAPCTSQPAGPVRVMTHILRPTSGRPEEHETDEFVQPPSRPVVSSWQP